ncbi:MAG: AAA family ATPase [Bacteroidetes bacterium]|nr:AAA family ATPase [Bacteroidota bacterium]
MNTPRNFKLLAIRPLKGCPRIALKRLVENETYKFYNLYEFKHEGDETTPIIEVIRPKVDLIDLYSSETLQINVSAVVGANGSGKSSLLELFYLVCYALAVDKDKSTDDVQDKALEGRESLHGHSVIESIKVYREIKCEVYYEIDKDIYRLSLIDNVVVLELFDTNEFVEKDFIMSNFFYTLASNYALYGLNSSEQYWLNYLFHKNDAYQTPLVINPYRDKGNIDVNSELHLANSRTLLNLTASDDNLPIVVYGKRVKSVNLSIDPRKNDAIRIGTNFHQFFWTVIDALNKNHEEAFFDIFNKLSSQIANFSLSEEEKSELKEVLKEDDLLNERDISQPKYSFSGRNKVHYVYVKFQMVKYVINKAFKIALNYPKDIGLSFKGVEKEDQKLKIVISKFEETVLPAIIENKTHITLKLRQALFFILEDYFKSENWSEIRSVIDDRFADYYCNVSWANVASAITLTINKYKLTLDEQLVATPGALVKPSIIINDPDNIDNNYSYAGLSSGEQQMANILQTISYHIYNLDSVHNTEVAEKDNYRFINILFDEVELYFHPEFQRRLVSELVTMLQGMEIDNIDGVNILCSTHSPIILSDIPNENVLKLIDGIPQPYNPSEQTFGANVHDLLANDFFLKNGFMGKFAKGQINEVIDTLKIVSLINEEEHKGGKQLNEEEKLNLVIKNHEFKHLKKLDLLTKEECENIISVVGEPMLYMSMMELYADTFKDNNSFISAQIDRLNTLKS